nr:4'-phosphopantetheinyl transferase superfamily protein [Lachnospiraceae bacterium]
MIDVDVYELDIQDLEEGYLPYIECLSAERQEAVKRFLFFKDKAICLWSGLLVRKIISERYGVKIPEQKYGVSQKGKPFYYGSSVQFNISHSSKKIIVGFALSDIGVDVEKIEDAPLQIMGMVFHDNEIRYVSDGVGEEQNKRFFKVWTRKESFCKCSGKGLNDDLKYVNTLEKGMDEKFYSWENNGYCYSIFMEKDFKVYHHPVSIEDIDHFYV